MLSCWHADPDKRPTFSQLITTIVSVLAPLADYMDVATFITEGQVAETTFTDITTEGGQMIIKNEAAEECTPEEGTNLEECPQSS